MVFDWESQLLQRVVLDEGAVVFKKTVFIWEAHLLQRVVLEEKAVGFKKTVFDWEAQLLQKAVLDENGWLSRRRCSTGRTSCSRGLC